MCQPIAQHVPLPEDFFDGVDVVALATTVHKPCSKCGCKQGVLVRGGRAFCPRCNNQRLAAKQLKRGQRPVIVRRMPTSTPRPRQREGGARMVAASGRDGDGERNDGGGSDDGGGGSDGGGSSEPPGPRSHAPFAGGVR